jgi:hypothetical protein
MVGRQWLATEQEAFAGLQNDEIEQISDLGFQNLGFCFHARCVVCRRIPGESPNCHWMKFGANTYPKRQQYH